MEEQKWEDLKTDCLVNVFGRVGMESIILDVPLVCKSWYKATLNPLCWQHLVFPKDLDYSRLDEYHIKFAVKRSKRSAISLVLPSDYTKDLLIYVGEECPGLKFLALPYGLVYKRGLIFQGLISKWKNLEKIRLGSSYMMKEIIGQISLHCKNFDGLAVAGAYIGNDEASTIVTLLPNIKYLYLWRASLERQNLVTLLQGCKQLVHLDVSNCVGFEGDEEIVKLASHIPTFKYEGSVLYDDDDDCPPPNYRDDVSMMVTTLIK